MMYVMIDWHILVEYYIRYLCNHWGRLRGFDTRHCCGRCTVQQPAGDPSSWRPSNIIQLAVVLLAPLPPDGSLWRLLERWWSWMQHATCNNGNGSIRIWSGRCVVWIFQWVVTLTASHFLTHTERHRTSTKHEAKHNGNGTISSSTYCRANLRRAPGELCSATYQPSWTVLTADRCFCLQRSVGCFNTPVPTVWISRWKLRVAFWDRAVTISVMGRSAEPRTGLFDRAWIDDSNARLILLSAKRAERNELSTAIDHWEQRSTWTSRGRFSWVDWQRVDIWPYNYNKTIELDERILNHYWSSWLAE